MNILGISHDVLICSAALVMDGKLIASIAEERLDRQKQSRVFPTLAIDACLEMGGISLHDIDHVAVAWNPAMDVAAAPAAFTTSRRWRSEHLAQVPARFYHKQRHLPFARHFSQGSLVEAGVPMVYLNHHLAHVGNAAWLSPFDECAVLVLDGRGERDTGLLATVRGTTIEVLEEIRFPHSLGLFYGAMTQYVGFRPDHDEWKVMALASYADPQAPEVAAFYERLKKLVTVDDRGRIWVSQDAFAFSNYWVPHLYTEQFVEWLGPARQRYEPITARHHQLAYAMQKVFEETIDDVLLRLHQRTGLSQLTVSGGCFMNSVYNGKISRQTPFRDVHISSCPDDSGTALGAAFYLHASLTGKRPMTPPPHNYWGRQFSDDDCWETALRYKLPNAEVVANPSQRGAEDLMQGMLVGWFQGRSEFGQRALGNRSILCDPRRPDARDIINAAVKFRESFRPFAPAILKEFAPEYFDCEQGTSVPYMERVLMFRPEKREQVPAVVHVDGSGRLQTVDEESAPRYRQLIEHFHQLTGVPIVLNTSFNLNGEPIVDSPEDAVRTFYSCGLDVMYLGNVRVSKNFRSSAKP